MKGMVRVLTSATSPLRIDTLPIPGTAGCMGLTFCPGKHHFGAETGDWARDLETDLRALVDWRAETLVTLMELDELSFFGVRRLPDAVRPHG
ncbi:MAG: protein tyrosine phosphatase, partial [Dehalococcoidia bacterium]|nr:protein tyrosine phosphatase [Dehalococcoidia bacterium]